MRKNHWVRNGKELNRRRTELGRIHCTHQRNWCESSEADTPARDSFLSRYIQQQKKNVPRIYARGASGWHHSIGSSIESPSPTDFLPGAPRFIMRFNSGFSASRLLERQRKTFYRYGNLTTFVNNIRKVERRLRSRLRSR